MTLDEYNAFCESLAHSTHVVQWGGSHVWKIGGKVYAIGGWNADEHENVLAVSFKCSPIAFEMLKEAEGVRPAPYLASRGMSWLQRTRPGALDDGALQDYIKSSYALVASGLTKKLQRELGLLELATGARGDVS